MNLDYDEHLELPDKDAYINLWWGNPYSNYDATLRDLIAQYLNDEDFFHVHNHLDYLNNSNRWQNYMNFWVCMNE